jgi:hypothetical protein
MRHFHVSEPQLADPCRPVVHHERVARALRESGYGRWVSLEMRRPDPAIRRIRTSVERVAATYGSFARPEKKFTGSANLL